MDFLNPRNPLNADARLRAVLGILGSWYPLGGMKFFGFAAAPRNSADPGGGGSRFGLGWENPRSRTSLQFLVSFESPHAVTAPAVEGYPLGLYRF
jgi:hypothetical protein